MFSKKRKRKQHVRTLNEVQTNFLTASKLLHWLTAAQIHGSKTVTLLAVEMCRKRSLNLETISDSHCSADPLPDYRASIFYAVVETQQGHLLSVTSSYLLKSSSCFEHMKPRLSASAQHTVMTFKWARSNEAALWPTWLDDVTGSEEYPYRGSPLRSQSSLMSSGVGERIWHRYNHAHLFMCTYLNRTSLQLHQVRMSVNQHHRVFKIITIKEKLTTDSPPTGNLVWSVPKTVNQSINGLVDPHSINL